MRSMKNDELFARISFELTISVSPVAVVDMIEPTMMEGTESFILLSKIDIVPVVMMKMIAVFSFYVVGPTARRHFL